MKKIFLILLFLVLALSITIGVSYLDDIKGVISSKGSEQNPRDNTGPTFAILPHHGITMTALRSFYDELGIQYPAIEQIIIISPDHYNVGGGFAQGVPRDGTLCFLSSCIWAKKLEGFAPKEATFPLFIAGSGDTLSTREHGIGIHFSYIRETFGTGTNVMPLVLRREKDIFPNTDRTFQIFMENFPNLDARTLVLASVDFSHHLDEAFAGLHDAKTIEAIQFGKDFSQTEVDCQNCLKLITDLARSYDKPYFELMNRTSVDTVTGISSGIGNTSHVFGIFREKKPEHEKQIFDEHDPDDTRVYGAFFGDAMFARDFTQRQNSDSQFMNTLFEEFSQENTLSKTGASFYHTKLYGFDFVGLNLETTIGTKESCKTTKQEDLSFVSPPAFLTHLRKIGITFVNIANNHSFDCGEMGYKNTEKFITESGLESLGNASILRKEIRGIKVAFIGINDFDAEISYEEAIRNIKNLSEEGYRVAVSVHWGIEYSTGHTQRQENIAHSLVDAGARIIIGHHPHVTQDVEIYKDTPIVYSLGNFVFDQPIPSTLDGQLLLFSLGKDKTFIKLVPFHRDPKDGKIRF